MVGDVYFGIDVNYTETDEQNGKCFMSRNRYENLNS